MYTHSCGQECINNSVCGLKLFTRVGWIDYNYDVCCIFHSPVLSTCDSVHACADCCNSLHDCITFTLYAVTIQFYLVLNTATTRNRMPLRTIV